MWSCLFYLRVAKNKFVIDLDGNSKYENANKAFANLCCVWKITSYILELFSARATSTLKIVLIFIAY